ncbi:MAG: glycosyltransferase family 4 protein [Nevskia sp.]|jgi:glycosyltransferase involved in cell wall biosynthesis|nr:glycosyltransferase family 4 protein [Nevskia sp.]MCK9386375.1 glycosyltransferase family 4 protein [Nevskia sp.]
MMNVLHVNKDFSGTGAQRVSLQILQRLDSAKCFFAADTNGHTVQGFVDELGAKKIERYAVLGLANKTILALPWATYKLYTFIKRNNIHVVHSHTFVAGIAARLAAAIARVPVIHTLHNLPSKKYLPGLYQLIVQTERALQRVSAKVICVNKHHLNLVFPNIGAASATVIPNFMAASNARKKRDVIRNVLFIGRFEFQKNPELFIEIAASCNVRNLPLKFRMVGGGALTKSIIRRINRLRASVEVLGFSHSPSHHFEWADCIVVTSRYETFSLVIGEGLNAGCHIICGDVDGLAEIWGNAVHFVPEGGLAEYCDQLEALIRSPPPDLPSIPCDLSESTFVARYRDVYNECIRCD